MKKRINLTIDDDLYADLDGLPRSLSVSQVATFLLKCYMELIKKGQDLNDEELDAIIESMGGEEFKARLRKGVGPTMDKIDWFGAKIKGIASALVANGKKDNKKRE